MPAGLTLYTTTATLYCLPQPNRTPIQGVEVWYSDEDCWVRTPDGKCHWVPEEGDVTIGRLWYYLDYPEHPASQP